MMDVHAGGHAPIEDLKMMLNLMKTKNSLSPLKAITI